jgi:NADH-quinone oxidoreductase subunit E
MTATQKTDVDLTPAEKILTKITHSHSPKEGKARADDLIPLLQEVQEAYGYLPPEVLAWISERTKIPTSRMYGVITFYAQFYLEPHGKHTVRCCRGTACHVRGGKKVINEVKNTLGIDDGETSDDMLFSLETVACLGTCALSPVIVVDNTYYGKMTPRRATQILQQLAQGEQ